MKIEISLPVWGNWIDPFLAFTYPALNAEAKSVGADIVIYTDDDGKKRLTGCADEFRELARCDANGLDPADRANADAIDRALDGGYAAAPLTAAAVLGLGTMTAAHDRLQAGFRAAMALTLPTPRPPQLMTALEMSRWFVTAARVLHWPDGHSHPGHYVWRCPDAMLVRPVFLHPVLISPSREHAPRRAVDHFMVEGYCDDISQVAYLEPHEGCMAGILAREPTQGAEPPPPLPAATPEGVAKWASTNAQEWNIQHHFGHRFWCGDPGDAKAETEVSSDAAVVAIQAAAHNLLIQA